MGPGRGEGERRRGAGDGLAAAAGKLAAEVLSSFRGHSGCEWGMKYNRHA